MPRPPTDPGWVDRIRFERANNPKKSAPKAKAQERLREAGALLHLSRSAVFDLIRRGELASTRHGKRRLISRASVERWANRRLNDEGFAEEEDV